MKFPKEVLTELLDLSEGDSEGDLTLVDEGDWRDEGKYSFKDYVFRHDPTGKHFQVSDSRTGSYYSDYFYESTDWPEFVECHEVERVEVKTFVWKLVEHKDS
jgi:hypothetical protein